MSVFIIAEAGVNHNGSVNLAHKLIDAAAESGADAVKFQTFKSEKLISKHAPKAEYQKEITSANESQLEMIKKLELSADHHKELMIHCQERNILFLSTPFDHDSIEMLNSLGLEIFKIPSGEITNLPYLRHIGSLRKRIILSTGMSNMKEVGDALNILVKSGTSKENITVLHANTMYPTPMEDVNLRAMVAIADTFDVKYGYSDHTMGIEVSTAAVVLGASVIEKHFTLDKEMKGPDHKASLDVEELREMILSIRNIEIAMGDGVKKPSKSEEPNILIARKSLVAKCPIKKGEIFSQYNVSAKRPGTGISPMYWDSVLGTVAEKNYQEDDLI